MDKIELVARAIACVNEDDFDRIPKHRSDWYKRKGKFNNRFRDINEPFQTDYIRQARAAIKAMRGPTLKQYQAVSGYCDRKLFVTNDLMNDIYSRMLTGALDESED